MPIEITMPRLSDTMETGTIIKWNIAAGDVVAAGDVIADIETDKATMEMQAFDDGTVAKILVPEGQTTEVGTVIALIAEDDEDIEQVASGALSSEVSGGGEASGGGGETVRAEVNTVSSSQATEKATTDTAAPVATASPVVNGHEVVAESDSVSSDGKQRISPVARRLADEHGLDVRSIEGSGPGGRIIKRDIKKAIETGAETVAAVPPSAIATTKQEASPKSASPPTAATPLVAASPLSVMQDQIVPVSNIRQIIAKRLIEQKTTVPHYQVTCTFNMDPLMELRKELNTQLASQQVKLSVNDFLIRGCALAMYDNPYFNASWLGESIQIHGLINIGMAISLPPERGGGLVVGVIRNADQKSLRVISAEAKYLAGKAREKGLTLEEMSDSTFTISNLGMFGVDHFTAIINPPNSAILAVGGAIQKPVVRDGTLTIGHEMSATLSSDHRVIDGAMAAQYLLSMRQYIENPAALLV